MLDRDSPSTRAIAASCSASSRGTLTGRRVSIGVYVGMAPSVDTPGTLVALVTEQEIYRLADLLWIAKEEDVPHFTRYMRRDWTVVGMLAPSIPEPRSPARQGVGRYWTHAMVMVFRAVLRWYRDGEPRRRIVNIPVAAWQYRGDAYAPLAQVRHALSTFVASRPSAAELAAEHERRDRYARDRLGPDGHLPDGVRGLTTAEHQARREAYERGRAIQAKAHDRLYDWARKRHLGGVSLPPALQAPQFYPAGRSDELVTFACADLLIALGEVSAGVGR